MTRSRDHGRRVHNMEPTRDQVLAMVVGDPPTVDRVDEAAAPPNRE